MKIDSAFQIGKTHDICEDFALTGTKNSIVPYTIVSDGCSSSPLTDVGSRILSFAAIVRLLAFLPLAFFELPPPVGVANPMMLQFDSFV